MMATVMNGTAAGSKLSLPNARPYPFDFPLETTALVLIDIQRDFVDPGGFGAIQCGNDEIFSQARAIVPAVKKVLDVFRNTGGHVIHTREGHQPDLGDLPPAKKLRQISNPNGHHSMGIGDEGPMGRLLVRGEYGHDIVDELQPWPTETVIDKPGKGSFWGTDLHRVLLSKGITHMIFAGVTTECCVTTTLRECNDRGYQCCVLSDCTQGFVAQQVTTSLDIVCAQDGLFGFVGHSSDFLAAAATVVSSESHPWELASPASGEIQQLPSVAKLQGLYRAGKVSTADIVNAVFDRIEAYKKVDPAVWTCLVTREAALKAAGALTEKYAGKPLPPLFGVPFSVKDNIDVADIETTSACSSYTYLASSNATAVQLVLDAGGIYIGKTNLDQLATGLSGCRSPFGTPHSTFSPDHISGGSSSGGAVAAGAGLVSFSLTTDTAGSTRIPAAYNGMVGLKPTKGTVSAKGLVPACKTLDTIGVISPNVTDTRAVWEIIAQPDRTDPYSKPAHTLPTWHVDFRGFGKGGSFTFAVPPSSALEACTTTYQGLFARAVQVLEDCGGCLGDVDYDVFDRAGDLLYDGALLHERIACIGEEFLRSSLDAGTLHPVTASLFSKALASSPSAHDVFRDQAVQAELTRTAQQAFDKLDGGGGLDVLVVPATVRHPTLAEVDADPVGLNSKLGKFTHYANVVDMCGITVPAGTWKDESGTTLPFGITILGASGQDAKIMDVAKVFEAAMRATGDKPA